MNQKEFDQLLSKLTPEERTSFFAHMVDEIEIQRRKEQDEYIPTIQDIRNAKKEHETISERLMSMLENDRIRKERGYNPHEK